MTTNSTLISDALKLLGVIAETQSVSAEQGLVALRRLNQMLALWAESDIELGWFEQTSTTDTAPLPKWAEMGVTSKLAQNLQPLYPASSLEPWVMDDSMNGYGVIARVCLLRKVKPASTSHLPMGEGSFVRSRILTDS